MKLSVQLTTIMLILVIIAVTVVGVTNLAFTSKILHNAIGDNQEELAKETMDKIDRILYKKYQEIQIIAHDSPIQELLKNVNQTKSVENRLNEFLIQTGSWNNILVAGINSNVIISTSKLIHSLGKEYYTAYFSALNGNIYNSDLEKGITGNPTMIFAAPVIDDLDPSRPVIGAVIAELSWQVIMEILDELEFNDRHVVLFNSDGMIIGTPTIYRNEILQKNIKHLEIVKDALRGECGSKLSEEDSHFESDEHSREIIPLLFSCALQNGYLGFKSQEWGLTIETPQSVIFEPVRKITVWITLIIAAIILLFIPVIILMSRIISQPIKSLTESNKDIISGKIKEAQQQQQQQQQQQLFLADEFKEIFQTREKMLEGLVQKKELDRKNKELGRKINELERWEKLTVGREIRIAELKKRIKEMEKNPPKLKSKKTK